VKTDLIRNEAVVRFDPSLINHDSIISAIRELGYAPAAHTGNDERMPTAGKGSDHTRKRNIMEGVAYGLIPHIGCIAFIIGSILGVTVLMQFFRPLLMNRYFFHILIALSIGFATLSSAFYLRKNGLLSFAGARRKWQYLSTMYGSTIGINLVLFMLLFPLLANVSAAAPAAGLSIQSINGAVVQAGPALGLASVRLSVDIPCPGHAPLISQELKTIDGISSIQFSFPNNFDVTYDPAKTSKDAMLALSVFKEYPAKVISSTDATTAVAATSGLAISNPKPASTTGSAGGCGGGGSCGGSGGGCGCGGAKAQGGSSCH